MLARWQAGGDPKIFLRMINVNPLNARRDLNNAENRCLESLSFYSIFYSRLRVSLKL